jgi:hypothetical protein
MVCGLGTSAVGLAVQTWTGSGSGPSGAGGGLGPGGVTPCTILTRLIGNPDQPNAISVSAYSSRTSEASAFAWAVSDPSARRNLALAFAEDVGTNLVGKRPVSAIVQMVAGNRLEPSGVLDEVGRASCVVLQQIANGCLCK